MKIKDIYTSALSILGEENGGEGNEDYEERAPYLVAAFCCEAETLDRDFRRANNLPTSDAFSYVCLPLDREFPCCERFVNAASMYLAAMLIIDENSELSDKLFDKYCVIMSKIHSEIPLMIEKISQKYL